MTMMNNGSATVMERLDNGLMPRALERNRDAVELTKDHAKDKKDPEII